MSGKRTATILMSGLLLANLVCWGVTISLAEAAPGLLALALVAWTFGLRHALDADHIAAIDSVTRRLMARGKPAHRVGLFFSLGHSTVVVVATLALLLHPVRAALERWQLIGGSIGATVSIVFLLTMAAINGTQAIAQARALRQGRTTAVAETPTGLLSRLLLPFTRSVPGEGWVYPLGVLFGLGFDTASEIGLLGLGLAGASRSPAAILMLPLLFTAGMALVDSLDTVLMIRAWSWSDSSPLRRARYACAITAMSATSAGLIGLVELAQHSGSSWLSAASDAVGEHFEALGVAISLIFLALWAGAALSRRLNAETGPKSSALVRKGRLSQGRTPFRT